MSLQQAEAMVCFAQGLPSSWAGRGAVHVDRGWTDGPATLLINWLYYPAVGHAVEALRLAVAFRAANPSLHIAALLNARTATELIACVPEIDALYTLDLGLARLRDVDTSAAPVTGRW
jgi:hypothetical protein